MEAAREARPVDIPRVVQLAAELRAELVTMRGGALWAATLAPAEPLGPHYADLLDRPAAVVLVGTIDGEVVGYGAAHLDVLRDGALIGVVDEVFVEPPARSVGVGEALLDALREWCAKAGCDGIDAVALPGHRAAKNFFEAHGFTARLLTMHRRTTGS